MLLAHRYPNSTLNQRINYKGRDEQELQFLFPSLYGNKAVTRRTIGNYAAFDRHINHIVFSKPECTTHKLNSYA